MLLSYLLFPVVIQLGKCILSRPLQNVSQILQRTEMLSITLKKWNLVNFDHLTASLYSPNAIVLPFNMKCIWWCRERVNLQFLWLNLFTHEPANTNKNNNKKVKYINLFISPFPRNASFLVSCLFRTGWKTMDFW